VFTQSTPFVREYDEYVSYWRPYPTIGFGYGFGHYW